MSALWSLWREGRAVGNAQALSTASAPVRASALSTSAQRFSVARRCSLAASVVDVGNRGRVAKVGGGRPNASWCGTPSLSMGRRHPMVHEPVRFVGPEPASTRKGEAPS